MKRILVRYKAKPDQAQENQRLIEAVFAELREKAPEGMRYAVLKLDDGTFIHFAAVEDGAKGPPAFPAFQTFQEHVEERCLELPQSGEVTIVGNYRMLGE